MAVTYSQNGVIVSPRNISLVAYAPSQSYTLIIDKNGYIGDKQLASGNTYFAYVDTRADFSQSGLGQVTIIIPEIGEAVIGDKTYKTTKIGNQIWLAENLDYKFEVNGSQIPIGSSTTLDTPAAWYYNNDELTYGWNGFKYGLLYNWYAAKYLNDNKSELLPNEWRVPSISDLEALSTACYGNNIAGLYLKSRLGWSSNGNGIDIYEFTAYPAGHRNEGNYFGDIDTHTNYWSHDETGNSAYYKYMNYNSSVFNTYSYPKGSGFSLRLVRDAT